MRTGEPATAITLGFLPRTHRIWLGFILVLVAYAVLFTFWQAEPVPAYVHAASILVVGLCFLPTALWYARGAQSLPIFEMICLAYAAQFENPLYLQLNQLVIQNVVVRPSWDSVFQALLLVVLGIVALLTGYYLAGWRRVMTALPEVNLPLHSNHTFTYLSLACVVGILALAAQTLGWSPDNSGGLGAVVRLLASQTYIAIVLLTYRAYTERKGGRVWMGMLYSVVGSAALLGLSTGLLENAFIPLVLFVAVRWHVTRRLQSHLLLAALIGFTLLNAVKTEYRAQAWSGTANLSLPQKVGLWLDAAQHLALDTTQTNGSSQSLDLFSQSATRFDQLHKFAYVLQLTPAVVPYFGGASYSYLLYGWIPRFLWPDKPVASDVTHLFDRSYNLHVTLSSSDGTNIGIGQLPEAYANFGVLGVAVVMFLQGIFFALLGRIFNSPQSDGGRAIYLSVMIFFLNGIGAQTIILFGNLIQNVVASAVLMRPFTSGWQRSPRVETTGAELSPVRAVPRSVNPRTWRVAQNGRDRRRP